MQMSSRVRSCSSQLTAVALAVAIAFVLGCGHTCGLGLRSQVTVQSHSDAERVCCGDVVMRDVALMGKGDSEFDLSNVAVPDLVNAVPVDAFLVPTSCAKLFDGPYPGSTALCHVYIGPTKSQSVSSRAALPNGTYRVVVQSFTSNPSPAAYLVDIGIYDYSCGGNPVG